VFSGEARDGRSNGIELRLPKTQPGDLAQATPRRPSLAAAAEPPIIRPRTQVPAAERWFS
jgi:hypothetical protein